MSPPSAYQWGSWFLPHTCLPSGNTAGGKQKGIRWGKVCNVLALHTSKEPSWHLKLFQNRFKAQNSASVYVLTLVHFFTRRF